MSRSTRFIAGTLAGYGSLGANILFTLLSVPLALAFLNKEQFGLWALAVQINGYLSLIELGMGNAINRFIADHKDNVNGGVYGSHILTSGLVFISQGLLIACAGIGFSWIAPYLFSIPGHLTSDFRNLLILLASFTGLSVSFRAVASPLWAFQRLDIINLGSTVFTLVSLAGLWIGFKQGMGIYSFPAASIPALILSPIFYFWVCKRSGYFPQKNHWHKPKWDIFKQIFLYGKDVFLVQVGNQLLNASQIIIISRFIGLGAAATYAIATKIYTMGILFLGNPISTAGPSLTELYVRGDQERFITRYWDLFKITLAASTVIAIGIASGNNSFITMWTKGAIQWPANCDIFLGGLIIFKSLNLVAMNLFDSTKNWAPVRYLYLAEAMVFVPLAVLFSIWFGVIGTVSSALLAHLLVTTPIVTYYARSILGPISHVIRPALISATLMVCAVTVTRILYNALNPPATGSLAIAAFISACSAMICYKLILPKEFKHEILRICRKFVPVNKTH